jgi:hypothetical protein
MSFDEEWAELSRDAAHKSTSMQLNEYPSEKGANGGRAGLTVRQKALLKAAQYIEDPLGPDTKKAANIADAGSALVTGSSNTSNAMSAGGLNGWETKKGMQHCVEEWEIQAKNLVSRLATEISALRDADFLYTTNEEFTASQFGGPKIEGKSPHSRISDYS